MCSLFNVIILRLDLQVIFCVQYLTMNALRHLLIFCVLAMETRVMPYRVTALRLQGTADCGVWELPELQGLEPSRNEPVYGTNFQIGNCLCYIIYICTSTHLNMITLFKMFCITFYWVYSYICNCR